MSEVIGGGISHFPLFIGIKQVAKMAELLVIYLFFLMLLYGQPASYTHGWSAYFIIHYHLLCHSEVLEGTQQPTMTPPAHTVLHVGYRLQDAKYPRLTGAHISALRFFPEPGPITFGCDCFLILSEVDSFFPLS